MEMSKRDVLTCDLLLQEFWTREMPVLARRKLEFANVGGKDVYNITAPFAVGDRVVLAGRVEARESEEAQLVFFVEREGAWTPDERAPVFRLQDPFFTKVKGELIVGGVETFAHSEDPGRISWRTVFYRGDRLENLRQFFSGPNGMKDIRLVELSGGDIGVFTRPQGEKGGRGKIGFVRVRSLDELTVKLLRDAPLLEEQFTDEEWGGVNEAHLLANGLVGALGHIARFDERGHRHYYPMVFALDPDKGAFSDIALIAVRDNFAPGPAKREDLQDVVFSGGLVRHADGTAALYAGISDAEAHCLIIPDPFLQYETIKR